MFNDVGKEIKKLAEIMVLVVIAIFAAIGLAVGVIVDLFFGGDAWFLFVIIFAFVGIFVGRCIALNFYAWGELVDRVTSIERQVTGNCVGRIVEHEKVPSTPATPSEGHQPVRPRDERVNPNIPTASWWTCSKCGHENAPNSVVCQNCFTMK